MIKIGLVGAAKRWHGIAFSEIINGYDKDKAVANKWRPLSNVKLEKDAKITHIWSLDKKDAQEVAGICGIDNVVNEKEDMIGKVDAVLIPDDSTLKHQKHALAFLKAGIPVFIDKPFSPDIEEVRELMALAKKHSAPLMSCSALRYAKETLDLRNKKDDIGDILTGSAICKEELGNLIYYGIHPIELLVSVVGPGIKSVKNIGEKSKDLIIIKYKDCREFVIFAYEAIDYVFQLNLYGTKGFRTINVQDSNSFYFNMLTDFIKMVETKTEPIPLSETLEIVQTVVLAEESKEGNREMFL